MVEVIRNAASDHEDVAPTGGTVGAADRADSRGTHNGKPGVVAGPDWSFAKQPFWLFSHVFALAVIVLFVNLGLWQLSRHDSRQSANAVIQEQMEQRPLVIVERTDVLADAADLAFRRATVKATFVESDFVRVVNRSQGGAAGEHVVAIVELADGSKLAVNRGFVPTNAQVELAVPPAGVTELTGWLRESVAKGRFGVDDSGQGSRIPRFNTGDLAARLGEELPSVWLQLEDGEGSISFPDPVPLPSFDGGSHLSYAVQWFIFATLGSLFYGALLWRRAGMGSQHLGPGFPL